MANTVILKRSSVAGKMPTASQLSLGELALNHVDRRIYAKDSNGAVFYWVSDTVISVAMVEPYGYAWDESGDAYQAIAMYRPTYGATWNESTDAYTTNQY